MPGPGSRGKGKSKAKSAVGSSSSGSRSRSKGDAEGMYLGGIDDVEGWKALVDKLCEFFDLPDLTSRSGLKKIHGNFSVIYSRMDNLYQKSQGNVKIQGAIVGIFAKMSIDSILRNKLFEKGILDKIMPLLTVNETRHLALRALSTITHHGGPTVRIEIAKHTHVLTKLINDLPDDEVVVSLAVGTLAHSIVAAVEGDDYPNYPNVLKSIDMVDVLGTVLDAVKRPYLHPRSIIEHTIEILSTASLHASRAFKAYPSAINFLAAGLRSNDWVCRCICLGGFIRLYRLEAEEDQVLHDPQHLSATIEAGVPPQLKDVMIAYGPQLCDTFLTLSCCQESAKAIHAYADSRDRDLYALGLKQAALIMKTEFSISDGMFESQDPQTGQFVPDDFGMPFTMWKDSLYHSAQAIRQKGKPGEEDLADILELKYFLSKQCLSEALGLAKKGVQRNPQQAYFYYILSLGGDHVQGLRAAKKGLKCNAITPFVKYQLLQRAVDHAGDMGIMLMQGMPESGEKKWEEGVAFLMSALEDAKAYIAGAPPDNRHMKNVIYWFVLLSILATPDMNPDLKDLDNALKKLCTADQFSELTGVTPPKTNMRLAQQAMVKHYPLGVREFSQVFIKLDEISAVNAPVQSPEKIQDDLEAWLEDMKLEEGTIEEALRCESSRNRPNFGKESLKLYRCSWCSNPSAVLRKCSGCSNSRYCDSACQKSHWKSHKKVCGSD